MPASEAEEMMVERLDNLGDPFDVLKLFSEKLGNDGNIKDASNVSFFRNLMTESDKLVSQCMFINVLQATKDKTVILKILNEGAWKTLYGWLQDAKSGLNKAFLLELLKLYQELPVTVELLKQNSCAKDIRHLIKCSDKKISDLSKVVVDKWMLLVKEKTGDTNKDATQISSHSHSRSAKDGKSSTKTSENGPSKSYQSSHKPRTSDDKNLSNNSYLGTGKSTTPDSSNQDSNSSGSASVTKETVQRPKTVKTIGSMFRSTGLEVESPLPHSKKKTSSSQSNSIPVSSVKKSALTSSTEKKSSVSIPSSSASSTSTSSSPTDVKPKIKLIPARAKPPEYFESSSFVDAFGTTEILPGRRKRKLSQSNLPPQKPPSSSTSTSVPTSPPASEDKKPLVPSFYRDTMEMNQDEVAKLTSNGVQKESTSPTNDGQTSMSVENDVDMMETKCSETKYSDVKLEDSQGDEDSKNGVKVLSEETIEPPSKKKKKAVSWPDDNKLCSFFYFQLDETERVNVNKIDFAETRKHELEMERQMFQNVKRMAHDTMAAKTQWRKPPLITGTTSLIIAGCNSTERKVQIEREQSVLQVLYFNKSMIPDNPAEADLEYVELTEPKDIPLTDESGTGEVCYDHFTAPVTGVTNPDVVPLMNLYTAMAPGEMQQNPVMQPPPQPSQMMPQIRPGPMPPFMQPMYNMPPNMPQQMPPNMNMPMMDGRPGQSGVGFDMQGPNQGSNMQGPNQGANMQAPMMPMMPPRPGMGGVMRGFPPMRPDLRPEFLMGPGPQNHPALRGGGDMEVNRMPGMAGRNERMMNPQDMPPRMMPPRDMRESPIRGTRPVCSHFFNGYCRYGNNCRYLHQRGNGSPH